MSTTAASIDPAIHLNILQVTHYDQLICRPACGIPHVLRNNSEPIGETLKTILAIARSALTPPELVAAQLSCKMKIARGLRRESPLTPSMQQIFLQLSEIRKEFFPFRTSTFNILRISIFTKLLDPNFISKLGREIGVFDGSVVETTNEEYVKNISKSLARTLYKIDEYLIFKNEALLKEVDTELKELTVALESMENFRHSDEEKISLQKTWINDLKKLISLLNQCINEPEFFPLLLQVAREDEISMHLVFDPSLKTKQILLLQTFAYSLNIFTEYQENLLSQHISEFKKLPREMQKKFLDAKGVLKELNIALVSSVLPEVYQMISLSENLNINSAEKICNCTPRELEIMLNLCEKIEKGRDNIQRMFLTLCRHLANMAPHIDHIHHTCPESAIFSDLVVYKSLWEKMILVNVSFCFQTVEKYIGAITSHVKNLTSIQTQLDKCFSLCTIYPVHYYLVNKLDVIQTTHFHLINQLKEIPEIELQCNDLLTNHFKIFMAIRGYFCFINKINHQAQLTQIKTLLKKHIQILDAISSEKCSAIKTLVQTFATAIDVVIYPQLLQTFLAPCGSQTSFKKTDFQFLAVRFKGSIEMLKLDLFDLESIPESDFREILKSMNQVLERFQQNKFAILAKNRKNFETEQLNTLALELLDLHDKVDDIRIFYESLKNVMKDQERILGFMHDVIQKATHNFICIEIFNQESQAFFAYCNEVYFDSLAPLNELTRSPRIEIVEEAASAPIEEIEVEHVATMPLEIKLFKDSKRDLESICRQLKSYSLPRGEINTDFLFRQERVQKAIENIQCYIPQIENLLLAFDQFPYQTTQALFSKLSNLIEQAGAFVASARNVTTAINHQHDLLKNLKALGVESSPIVETLNGWSSTRYLYTDIDLPTETVNLLSDLKSRKITVAAAKETLKQMMHDAYVLASGLLNTIAHVELQDSIDEKAEVADIPGAIMPPLMIDPLLDAISVLVIRTQTRFYSNPTTFLGQISDNDNLDDKRNRMQLVSSGSRIIKEALSNLSDLAKPISSEITYAVAESLLLNAALILERVGFITLARLNIVGKDNRHIVFSKPELLHDARELRFNHDLEKIFGIMNLEIIEARKDITTFFGNTVGGATRYLTQYKMGAALLLEEILFLNVIRKALQEGGLFKEEEHRRLKELFGSSENATPENVDIKLSQLMDIVNDKVARALELTAALLHHNLSTK